MTIRLIRFILFCFSLLLIVSSCKKINESTDIGGNVIPGVDGVTTFDTTITGIQTFNHIFEATKDSAFVGLTNDQILGNISNDPLFGKTNAKIFLQLKPEVYPWSFSEVFNPDSLYLDSVVLVLGWKANYGDTNSPQKINVKEVSQFSNFKADTLLMIRDPGPATTTLLGTKTFNPSNLKDSVKAYKDTTLGQLRIRLDNSFGRRLLDYDTTNAYANDSAFNTYFKGFALEPDQSVGNALMAFGIYQNANTKLAIYYRYTKGGKTDTTVSNFLVKPGFSANHNYVNRFDFAGTPLLAASNTAGEDDLVYIINTPGSYATIKIPALRDLSNRIIHRAELIVEQVYSPSDETFAPPFGLMLDVYDSTLGNYKFVPYDFNPDVTGNINSSFGLYGQYTVDGTGKPIKVWKFDLTRYVQNVLTKQEPVHDFRLFTTQNATGRIRNVVLSNTGPYLIATVVVNPRMVFGRVRVGGGNHATQKMRLRIVYTKI